MGDSYAKDIKKKTAALLYLVNKVEAAKDQLDAVIVKIVITNNEQMNRRTINMIYK